MNSKNSLVDPGLQSQTPRVLAYGPMNEAGQGLEVPSLRKFVIPNFPSFLEVLLKELAIWMFIWNVSIFGVGFNVLKILGKSNERLGEMWPMDDHLEPISYLLLLK